LELLSAVPRAAAPAPGLSRVRVLRRAPGGRGQRRLGGPVATVAVDALGADRGLAEVAAAAADATTGGTRCILFGPADEIRAALGEPPAALEVVNAPDEISNADEPAQAARSRQDASIVRAAKALGEGAADAVVTTGPTGAALAASLIHVKRLPGVYRPALAVVLPVPGRRLLLLDVGANVEVRPEHLTQFAFMGAAFSEGVLGVSRPRVGLLSIGEEAGKGTEDVVAAHDALSALPSAPFDFAGNVEGFDLTRGTVDVVVTDGFTGNVALKTLEATAKTVVGAIRDAIRSGTVSKLGGLLVRHKLTPLRESFSTESVGGAYLLGLRGLVVVCHGSSSRRAITNAIALAGRGVEEEVVRRTADSLAAAGVLRSRTVQDPSSVPADSVTSH
jgi:glycerol-3-phosphate acyltransferase PlsX